jgi:hypothetical protein
MHLLLAAKARLSQPGFFLQDSKGRSKISLDSGLPPEVDPKSWSQSGYHEWFFLDCHTSLFVPGLCPGNNVGAPRYVIKLHPELNSAQLLAMALSGFPEVSFMLGIEPELRRVSEQTGQPQGLHQLAVISS